MNRQSAARGLLTGALAILCAAAAPDAARAQNPEFGTRGVLLDVHRPPDERFGFLVYQGGVELFSERLRFGGVSAIDVSDDGRYLLALSDRGRWWRFRLTYNLRGRLSGARWIAERALSVDLDGAPMPRGLLDAEATAVAPGGGRFVAFETRHRIWRYPPGSAGMPGDRPEPVPTPPGLDVATANHGLKALARLSGTPYRLLALTERLEGPRRNTRVGWVGGAAGWERLLYRVVEDYEPLGATTLPDGDVLVVEGRQRSAQYSTRLVRVPQSEIIPGRLLIGREVGRLDAPPLREDFQAVAARRDGIGRTLVYLVSDNGFETALRRTMLLMFALEDGSGEGS